jgi:dienelactone hydrolase
VAAPAALAAQTVTFNSGGKVLHGLLYRPEGEGPFPAVLYNHSSAPAMLNNQAFELLAPFFVAHGWAFFAPYRRGQGLSADAGPYILDEIAAARARGGGAAASATLVRLMSTEQLQDQMAGLAWLQGQPFVKKTQIAAMGNSFGGIQTVLGAAQGGYCAAVDAAGGAESWEPSPDLRKLMVQAARQSKAPLFFLQAQNDYSLAPSRTLFDATHAADPRNEIHIYPAFGSSPGAGHSFAWRGVQVWGDDVLGFLDKYCLH